MNLLPEGNLKQRTWKPVSAINLLGSMCLTKFLLFLLLISHYHCNEHGASCPPWLIHIRATNKQLYIPFIAIFPPPLHQNTFPRNVMNPQYPVGLLFIRRPSWWWSWWLDSVLSIPAVSEMELNWYFPIDNLCINQSLCMSSQWHERGRLNEMCTFRFRSSGPMFWVT